MHENIQVFVCTRIYNHRGEAGPPLPTNIKIHISAYLYIHTCIHIPAEKLGHIHTHICKHIHVFTHTYTHRQTHTCGESWAMAAPASLTKLTASSTLSSVGFSRSTVNNCGMHVRVYLFVCVCVCICKSTVHKCGMHVCVYLFACVCVCRCRSTVHKCGMHVRVYLFACVCICRCRSTLHNCGMHLRIFLCMLVRMYMYV